MPLASPWVLDVDDQDLHKWLAPTSVQIVLLLPYLLPVWGLCLVEKGRGIILAPARERQPWFPHDCENASRTFRVILQIIPTWTTVAVIFSIEAVCGPGDIFLEPGQVPGEWKEFCRGLWILQPGPPSKALGCVRPLLRKSWRSIRYPHPLPPWAATSSFSSNRVQLGELHYSLRLLYRSTT